MAQVQTEEDQNTPVPTTEADSGRDALAQDATEGEAKTEEAAAQDAQTTAENKSKSNVKDDEWKAMQSILKTVYNHRTPEGHDASRLFQKNVNRRNLPVYYEQIKEPMALSVIKKKINFREYKDFPEFVRDFALISHNAQVFNRANSGAYQDALVIRTLVEDELQKLVELNIISKETATPPYLGEIPVHEDPVEEEEEEEDDEDDEEEDEGAMTDDSRKNKGRRGRPRKRDKDETGEREGWKKKRGRPPKVDTPLEGRIKNVLKGLRRQKQSNGELKIFGFDRLPDKSAMPDYYQETKNPMAVDIMKKKLKRKKYRSFQQFMEDVELMFENAKSYNTDDSQIYKDAVALQTEARNVAAAEQARPDTDFAMEDGRLPLPDGVEHKGETWKVGDWIHLLNPNDLTKPIPVQVYRTWQDGSGQKYVNVCWYYRPEQTVHRFDRHFYENEIVKTGQYRDHAVDEIVDRCFVQFVTRYSKGRPKGLPAGTEIYICESRYNEEKHTFNKIKTWASCLPDEVRDQDYEMESFGGIKKLKKLPSPIAYLLKDEQTESDELPKPEWGADNAPPKLGAVHRRPRDPKDSPPPEPTPTPPPREPTPPPRPKPAQLPQASSLQQSSNMNTPNLPTPMRQQPSAHHPLQQNLNQQYRQHQNMSPSLPRQPPTQGYNAAPASNNYAPSAHAPSAVPQQRSNYQSDSTRLPPTANYATTNSSNAIAQAAAAAKHNAPHPVEVYTLPEGADSRIPAEIRERYQADEQGRILWFTAPPVASESAEEAQQKNLKGHSVRYLAEKQRREQARREKRKRGLEAEQDAEERRVKAAKVDMKRLEEAEKKGHEVLLEVLAGVLTQRAEEHYKVVYGARWEEELTKAKGMERSSELREAR